MKKFLLIYFSAGVVWFIWSKVIQGYASTWTDILLWPIKLFTQIKSQGSAAQ